MKSQLHLLLLFSIFFYATLPSFSQDEVEGFCDLPAPQDILFNSAGPDHLDFYWTPVLNASGYDVVIIDLNTNIILHNSIEYTTQFSIGGIVITQSTFVSVAALCENGSVGEPAVTGGGIITRVFEDLLLESTMPDGTIIRHTCGDVDQTKMDPNWTGPNAPGTISLSLNTKSEVTAEVYGTQYISGVAHDPFSLVILGTNTSAYSKFPSFNSYSQQSINTAATRTSNGTSSANANIDYTQLNQLFYDIDSTSPNTVDLTFTSTYHNLVMVITRYCLRGEYQEFRRGLGNVEGLQSTGNTSESLSEHLPDNTYKVNKAEVSSQDFKLSPNPTSNKLNINLPTEGNVEILDINGRVWYKKYTSNKQTELTIANWPAGTYIIRYDGKDAPIVERFIKL